MQHEISNVDPNPTAHAIAHQARTVRIEHPIALQPQTAGGCFSRAQYICSRNFVCENKHASYDPRGNNLAGRRLARSVAG